MSGALKRDEWKTVRLGDVCEISAGGTPSRTRVEYWKDGTIPWVKISDISGKYLSSTEEKITQLGLDNSPAKIFSKGTILYTIFATIGDVCILNIDAATNQAIVGMTFNERYDKDYVYYLLSSLKEKYEQISRGIAQKNINQSILKNTDIPLPPLDVQRRIADTLDKVTELITLRKTQLKKLDELVKARFVELFGDPFINPMKWKKIKIEEAVTVEPQNGMYKPQSDYVTDGSGTPILRIDGFYDGVVTDFSSLKRLLCEDKERQKYLLKEDDIVINRVNSIEYLGKCAHITGLLEDTVYESNMMRMHFDSERFNPVYVTHLLCSRFIYDQIVNHAKKAVNQASINQKDVLDFDIYQPPIELQRQFATFVKQTDKSKVIIQQNLDTLEILKESLMQEYFG